MTHRRFSWLLVTITLAAILLLTAKAEAHIGFATGFGLHAPHPFTPHIGRFYYTPGDKVTAAGYRAATGGTTELEQFLASYHHARKKLAKLRCDRQHIEYIGRHGFTTPRPLKGFSGCKKYAMDAGYWRNRRNEPKLDISPSLDYYLTNAIPNHVEVAAHNLVLPW